MSRRLALVSTWLAAVNCAAIAAVPDYPAVTPGYVLTFPRDFGSHPAYRTEWWYLTGWLSDPRGSPLGFQVTFFRNRPQQQQDNPSAFAARQLLIAHVALSDPRRGRLWQDQRIRRAGFDLADALTDTTDVWIDDWVLRREGDHYVAVIAADGFALNLTFTTTQVPLLNGDSGFSQKGPAIRSASYYYSEPHLRVSGTLSTAAYHGGVTGEAWLDHEWSSEYLDVHAIGWDWIGINLKDGGALMAFQIRDRNNHPYWTGATLRDASGKVYVAAPANVAFSPGRLWRSPRTGVTYPVSWRVQCGEREFAIEPLMADQENDARLSSGTVYWEGAVRVTEHRQLAGLGYLELTGYDGTLTLTP